jgi:hypothetical protein
MNEIDRVNPVRSPIGRYPRCAGHVLLSLPSC